MTHRVPTNKIMNTLKNADGTLLSPPTCSAWIERGQTYCEECLEDEILKQNGYPDDTFGEK